MNHLNSLLIEGVVAQKPELKTTNSGSELVVFTIVSHRYTRPKGGSEDQWVDEAIFLDVLAWGELGRLCMDLLEKGMTCRVVGRFRLSTYTGKDGNEKTRASIVAQHVEFKRRKRVEEGKEIPEEDVSLNASFSDEMPSLAEPFIIYEY